MIDPITVSYHDGANGSPPSGMPYNLSYDSGVNQDPTPGPIYIGSLISKQNSYAVQDMGLYHYALSNPNTFWDPLGLWALYIDLNPNRDKEGTWTIVDNDGGMRASGKARGRGSDTNKEIKEGDKIKKIKVRSHTEWKKTNGDTPTGIYRFEKQETLAEGKARGSACTKTSCGNERHIMMEPIAGNALEAAKAGRGGIFIHEGRFNEYMASGNLYPTHGCVRLTSGGMKELNDTIDQLRREGDYSGTIMVDENVLPPVRGTLAMPNILKN